MLVGKIEGSVLEDEHTIHLGFCLPHCHKPKYLQSLRLGDSPEYQFPRYTYPEFSLVFTAAVLMGRLLRTYWNVVLGSDASRMRFGGRDIDVCAGVGVRACEGT